MKRKIACLLAVVLFLGAIKPIYDGVEVINPAQRAVAAEAEWSETSDTETGTEKNADFNTEITTEGSAEKDMSSQTDVEVSDLTEDGEVLYTEDCESTEMDESVRTKGNADEENSGSVQAPVIENKNIGQVDVIIEAALDLEKPVKFAVNLSGASQNSLSDTGQSKTITIGGEEPENGKVTFEELQDGEYTLMVTAPGFAVYSQNITVEKKAYAVKLMTGFLAGMNDYKEGSAHPGVLLIGDVNGDGRVDATDKTMLVDAIDSADNVGKTANFGRDGEAVLATDLNGDGVTDLADLEYFAKGQAGNKDTLAKIEEFISAAAIGVTASEGTKVKGNLEALLKRQSGVSLTPANGETISEDNPVALEFVFSEANDVAVADGIVIETGDVSSAVIWIEYIDENGQKQSAECPVDNGVHYLLNTLKYSDNAVNATLDAKGNIEVHLGGQVAVKKVTLTITGTTNNNNLAEISKVEFVNGMEDRIPEPEMDIPQNLEVTAGSKQFSLSWDPCVNVTAYEVLITHGNDQETITVAKNALLVTSFAGKELQNYQEYVVKVQSINGTWRSGYGEEKRVMPKPAGRPDKPDNVNAVGKYQSIDVSWKLMEDTQYYNLYYRKSSDSEYIKIGNISGNSYTITGLEDLTEYTVYVTGVNEFGESAPSLSSVAVTTDLNPAKMPRYHLINASEEGMVSTHIISASTGGQMIESPLDIEAGTAWGTVDNNPASYYYKGSWDDGGFNALGQNGLTFEFDQAYEMDTIALQEITPQSTSYYYARVRYWDVDGNVYEISRDQISVQRKTDKENRPYYLIKLPQAVKAKKIQFGMGRYYVNATTTISEVYFYYYDPLMDEIMALYQDDLHTVLREDVTQETIDALRVKVNTIDEVSGEYNPDREVLERELQTAEEILNNEALYAPVEIHSGITTNDVNRGFGGLNAWQPLGVTAAAGEELVIYVGHNSKKTGENTNLQLVATQYFSESSSMSQVVASLKVGANRVVIPKIWTTGGIESGGALYIQYTGSNANDRYAVRVSGGVRVPKLDLYQVTDTQERLARTVTYVEELLSYVSRMQATHNEVHLNGQNSQVNYEYDERTCILGASDILLDTMMFSLPAQQILNGAGSGDTQAQAQTILNSMDAMEGMMYLFYQHKGLNNSAADAKDQIPKGHLNIRYQRMFSGAFMYASGNHIGIQWAEASGMMNSVPVISDSEGRYQSGNYFGWGIAHEIGHCINQSAYEIAEITNNYFAQLAQAKDSNEGLRFKYENIYAKVTSGAKGASPNIATQLGMYWQLHLAYDRGYNYKTYENYKEQLANLFYARVDTYARDTSKAPAAEEGGIALTLSGDKDQDLMRLACAAAEKNILEFFVRWGKTPNEATRAYAEQFEEETRTIYYVSDDSRVYSLQGGTSRLGTAGTVDAVSDSVAAAPDPNFVSTINITLGSKNIPEADILGYEIVRCTISGGKVVRETAGFTTENTFSDSIPNLNNRVITYEITLVDKYLNRSAVKTLEPVKIEDEGSLDKTFWTVETRNLTAALEDSRVGDENSPCEPEPENPADKMIDHNVGTVYQAVVDENADNAEIIMEFHKNLTVTGFRYNLADTLTGDYEVQLYSDGEWILAAVGTFTQETSDSVYFANGDNKYVSTYEASAAKLILKNMSGSQVSVTELDMLGVTGDNVGFRRTTDDGTALIGRLKSDFQYGQNAGDVIPAGSVIFTGAYKGNPAYNVVLLYDQDGNIVGGTDEEGNLKAQQIILADVPEEGEITNVSDGTWIYWIEPQQQTDLAGIRKVRAELYRVNNALNNEGQRLVSDSLFETMPYTLPEIEFTGSGI